jgi:hypothetical protein
MTRYPRSHTILKNTRFPADLILDHVVHGHSMDEIRSWFDLDQKQVRLVYGYLRSPRLGTTPANAEPGRPKSMKVGEYAKLNGLAEG